MLCYLFTPLTVKIAWWARARWGRHAQTAPLLEVSITLGHAQRAILAPNSQAASTPELITAGVPVTCRWDQPGVLPTGGPLLSAYVCDCKQNLFGQSCPSYPWQSPALGAMVFSERARCEAAEALAPFWLCLSHQWGKGFVLVKEWHRALSQLVHELIQYASSTDNMPGPAPALESQWELFWNMMNRKRRWKLMLFFGENRWTLA